MIRRSYYSAQLPSIRVKVYSYGKLWVNLGWLLSSYDGRCICFTDSWICVLRNFFTVMLSHLKSVGGAKQVGSSVTFNLAGTRTQFVRIWSYKLISQNQIFSLGWVIVQKKRHPEYRRFFSSSLSSAFYFIPRTWNNWLTTKELFNFLTLSIVVWGIVGNVTILVFIIRL